MLDNKHTDTAAGAVYEDFCRMFLTFFSGIRMPANGTHRTTKKILAKASDYPKAESQGFFTSLKGCGMLQWLWQTPILLFSAAFQSELISLFNQYAN